MGTLCECKTTQKRRWTRRNNFAPIRHVLQEAKWERAIFGFMIEAVKDIGVEHARKPLVDGVEP